MTSSKWKDFLFEFSEEIISCCPKWVLETAPSAFRDIKGWISKGNLSIVLVGISMLLLWSVWPHKCPLPNKALCFNFVKKGHTHKQCQSKKKF